MLMGQAQSQSLNGDCNNCALVTNQGKQGQERTRCQTIKDQSHQKQNGDVVQTTSTFSGNGQTVQPYLPGSKNGQDSKAGQGHIYNQTNSGSASAPSYQIPSTDKIPTINATQETQIHSPDQSSGHPTAPVSLNPDLTRQTQPNYHQENGGKHNQGAGFPQLNGGTYPQGASFPQQNGGIHLQGGSFPQQNGAIYRQGGGLSQQNSGIHPQGGSFPQQNGGIYSQGGSFPQQTGGIHPQGGGLPQQNSGIHFQGGSFPQQNGAIYPQGGGLPQQNGGIHPEGGSFPQQNGRIYSQGGGFPQQTGRIYPQGGGLPQQSNGIYPQSSGFPQPNGGTYSQGAGFSTNTQTSGSISSPPADTTYFVHSPQATPQNYYFQVANYNPYVFIKPSNGHSGASFQPDSSPNSQNTYTPINQTGSQFPVDSGSYQQPIVLHSFSPTSPQTPFLVPGQTSNPYSLNSMASSQFPTYNPYSQSATIPLNYPTGQGFTIPSPTFSQLPPGTYTVVVGNSPFPGLSQTMVPNSFQGTAGTQSSFPNSSFSSQPNYVNPGNKNEITNNSSKVSGKGEEIPGNKQTSPDNSSGLNSQTGGSNIQNGQSQRIPQNGTSNGQSGSSTNNANNITPETSKINCINGEGGPNQTCPEQSPDPQFVSQNADVEETQSSSRLHIRNNSTTAGASAQSKTKNGVAQVQVSGTYTDSFLAQAQTSDNEKSVQTQIFGNNSVAKSSSQSKVGKLRSQSQISYNYHTGGFLGETQGNGKNYHLRNQIQAGRRGGSAQAQATAPSGTSSQAQIGFSPPDEKTEIQPAAFEGGGESSSQNRGYSGQAEIQFQGSFKSGPSFTGGAQATAGVAGHNETFNSVYFPDLDFSVETSGQKLLQEDEKRNTSKLKTGKVHESEDKVQTSLPLRLINKSIDPVEEFRNQNPDISTHSIPESYNSELASSNNDDETSAKKKKKQIFTKTNPFTQTPLQTQNTYIRNKNYDADVYRDSTVRILNPGDTIPDTNGHRIPTGFRGRIMSSAGDITEAVAGEKGQAQTQTVFLKPGTGRLTIRDPNRMIYTRHTDHQGKSDVRDDLKNSYNDYVTVTKSEMGELQNGNRKYAHTYYTKSSSCGYFTFTCTVIDGKTKICDPGFPTYADGTPC